jgi:hypothetical protein
MHCPCKAVAVRPGRSSGPATAAGLRTACGAVGLSRGDGGPCRGSAALRFAFRATVWRAGNGEREGRRRLDSRRRCSRAARWAPAFAATFRCGAQSDSSYAAERWRGASDSHGASSLSDITVGAGARLAGRASNGIAVAVEQWMRRRRAYRARVAHAEWDLNERYGPAAVAIARSSARQAIGRDARRFWDEVAARLQKRAG